MPQCVDIISDILQNSKLEPSAIERERDVILRESDVLAKVVTTGSKGKKKLAGAAA